MGTMAQILLVDDDTNVLLTLAIALRRQGHVVTLAQNGWQALNLLRRQSFAFLISDVKMPGMTGVELSARAHELPNPPVVVLTSALELDIEGGIAEYFLPKPIDVAQLQTVLMNDMTTNDIAHSSAFVDAKTSVH